MLHALNQGSVKTVRQQSKFPLEILLKLRAGLLSDRQGKTPDLGALLFSEVSKILVETMQLIAFGHQNVNRQAGGKGAVQLHQARAD